MKLIQNSQEQSAMQSLLEEYLTLKPHRAVERLLQENNLPQCFDIYNLLQESVKDNTSRLRKVLYSKHENLHQCSQMIQQIQDFAEKVKHIQNSIDDLLKTQTVQEEQHHHFQKHCFDDNPVGIIEELMKDNKYALALKECGNYLACMGKRQSEQDNQLYYINFLKVQVVQQLQQHLEGTTLTSKLIHQAICALKQFMVISTVQDLQEYVQQSLTSQQSQPALSNLPDDSRTLLALLYEKYEQQQNKQKRYPLEQEEIVEVIFKFKLLTLKKSTQNNDLHTVTQSQQDRVEFLYAKVFHYFSDLLQILEEVSSKQNGNPHLNSKSPHSRLHQIFSNNIQKMIQQISEIFITDKRKQEPNNQGSSGKQQQNLPTLTFEKYLFVNNVSELYEKLTNSQEFIDVLTTLEMHFVSQQISQNPRKNSDILGLIKNLWKDFYHQMLDIITEKINPSAYFKIQQPLNAQPLEQFQRFSVIPFQKLTKQKLQHYQQELSVFFGNFFEILNKSRSSQEKSAIVQYFLQLKLKIQEISSEYIISLNQSMNESVNQRKRHSSKKQLQLKVRQILILYFLIQTYNNAWILNFQEDSDLSKLLRDCHFESNSNQDFQILIFSKTNHPQSLFQQFFQIIDMHINISISYLKLSGSGKIQRWQQQFDNIFGLYNNILKESQTLGNHFKQLILALIKTKLQQLQQQ